MLLESPSWCSALQQELYIPEMLSPVCCLLGRRPVALVEEQVNALELSALCQGQVSNPCWKKEV